ncbi:OsmC family protein [Nitrosomonas sp. Nm58]|jgi:putative redox protein|uniref:OsmC family protein n=1 Tax=Nitrosomonas sp. Nm58 TaxID=200126 RepID=UPI0008998712|nr:OsmC family protein [Nitrosomonas sp. Nm58]SDY67146.1 putative redox protein [Nitrosomonas sp. Nm58]
MKSRIKWQDGIHFTGETESGHAVQIDGAPDIGGKNLGPRPMELILLGLGGCSSIDVILILQKSRQEITDCVVEIDAARATEDPKVFTDIHLHFIVTGKNLKAQQVERAINLSAEKYCSASIMLKSTVNITHDFEIVEG